MAPTHNNVNRNPVQGSRDSHVPNGRPTPMEVDNGNGLTITASLSESPRFARRNQSANSTESVTVSPRPGDQPTMYTVLRDGNGIANVSGTVNRQADVLGTITIGNDTCVPGRPIPQRHTFQIFVKNFANSKDYAFDVEREYRVEKLMDEIFKRLDIVTDQQKLTYAGKNLERGMTLGHYDIKEHSTVLLTARLRGG
ncbi:unnamed protein product [Lymnaea stagnalis]|uniref:Ubiquitin-like domain-containing protein n=1 Tax=Lymnaea stagnalis TaxID=6523 RepID=A0AAV2HWX2_LYMST